MRVRTKLLVFVLLILSTLTSATLLVLHSSLKAQVRTQIASDLRSSVLTYRNVQREREASLSRVAELLADVPHLKALMYPVADFATVQDASEDLWRLGGSDLFVLLDASGRIVALHSTGSDISRRIAEPNIRTSIGNGEPKQWWALGGRLYEVFVRPISVGGPQTGRRLVGSLALGYEIDERTARDIARVASSQVAFRSGNSIYASTLPSNEDEDLLRQVPNPAATFDGRELELRGERFLATSVPLSPYGSPDVTLIVLKSYDQAVRFMDRLNRLLVALGVLAILAGTALVFLLSRRITQPLERLVAGVRALSRGNFSYPLQPTGRDEFAEVTTAFSRMRDDIQQSQRQLVHSERLATIGRMAASISHDLRHPLSAIQANAEFLCGAKLKQEQREELYTEIRMAVNQMTDLIESLLEFSRTRENLHCMEADVNDTIADALQTVKVVPDFQQIKIQFEGSHPVRASFDPKKLRRTIFNLLMNACESASSRPDGQVIIRSASAGDRIAIDVIDNGPGVPDAIVGRLFLPFASYGKANGTGLGLTIARKIVEDHNGTLTLESTGPDKTIFRIVLPRTSIVSRSLENQGLAATAVE